jgi:hypothetical protein
MEFGNLERMNGEEPERKGWFIGHFIPDTSLLHSKECEVKWAHHPKGLKKTTGADLVSSARTVAILLSGRWAVRMKASGEEKILEATGDYLAYEGGEHESEALEDSHVMVIRWPSK